jgi:hypothetical protein
LVAPIAPDREPGLPDVGSQGPEGAENRVWYLGIDLGSTGISAALLNQTTAQLHPVSWSGTTMPGSSPLLRLPAVAFLADQQLNKMPEAPSAVGDRALQVRVSPTGQPIAAPAGLLLANFRHYLDVAIPYLSIQTPTWEPVLQWSEQQPISLAWIQQAVVALLKTLVPQPNAPNCVAEGLEPEEFQTALSQLAGVVVGCPTGWSDAYRFNLREAVLAAGLVPKAEQIFFVEDTIAALLSELPIFSTSSNQLPIPFNQSIRNGSPSWQGGTLVLSAGATLTELLLVNLPENIQQLTRNDLALRSVDYGGNAIDQDIICQLFYPAVWGWRNLGEPSLDLPLPGEPDLPIRYRLQQRLQTNDLGRILLTIARQLKVALQQQDSATFSLNDQQWTMNQQDLHSRIIVPYIQLMNGELNALLAQIGMGGQAIRQIVCTGRTTFFPAIAHWLQQKFPNATLIQNRATPPNACSQVAQGLAKLPLYAQFLEVDRHQYSEYFLLKEILRLLPDRPLSWGHILQLLEKHGIDTQACQKTILDLLEGQIPAGLVPSKPDSILLTPESRQNPEYQAVSAAPAFLRQSNQVYSPNPKQRDCLRLYFTSILENTHQKLEAPLSVSALRPIGNRRREL